MRKCIPKVIQTHEKMSFEKLIVNPLQKVWLVSLHCDYILSENRHTRVWLLLTFKRLHLMYCAESEMRFNCEFAVPLWINQCSKRWQGSWRVEQHYLTSIFSVFSVQRGFGAGVMDAFWVDSSYWSTHESLCVVESLCQRASVGFFSPGEKNMVKREDLITY